jgi:hypothetical protein
MLLFTFFYHTSWRGGFYFLFLKVPDTEHYLNYAIMVNVTLSIVEYLIEIGDELQR